MSLESKQKQKVFYCTKCLTFSTRPRITFDEKGVCSACIHTQRKKEGIDWPSRHQELKELCDKYRSKDGSWDVIVPGSGGKDSCHVAWKMKNDYGMNPLCITLASQMPTEIGKNNLKAFVDAGFDHIMVTPNPKAYQKLSKVGFVEEGRPKMPFVTGVTTVVVKMATLFNVPFIMYGEEGETEYGGVTSLASKPHMDREETVKCYFSGFDPDRHVGKYGVTKEDVQWWRYSSQEELDRVGIFMAFWSYFEDWNPYDHYLSAKKNFNFGVLPTRSIGTYTNFAQLDDDLQDLHVYLMFLKFGFGRAVSDSCIDVRRGALDRKQALALVKRYDGEYPEKLIPKFCEYFGMSKTEFEAVLGKWVNKDLLEKKDGTWQRKFDIY